MAEICVVGAGPAGSTFAARMAQLGHQVHLIERKRFPRSRLGESLSRGGMTLLRAADMHETIDGYWRGRTLPAMPRIEAGEDAWYWGVPLPDGSYNTLGFVDPGWLRSAPGSNLPERFQRLIERSGLMDDCRDAALIAPVTAIDATPYLSNDCVAPNRIQLGDAALAIDPISSSGVQKAIQSALSGAIVANTLLRRPELTDAALGF